MIYLLRIFGFAFLIFRPLAKEFFNLTKVFMMARDGIFVECKKRKRKREGRGNSMNERRGREEVR
jgi:hypothetical protein